MGGQSISHRFVFLGVMVLILGCEAIVVLLSFFQKGIVKREVLASDTSLGFDLVIKKN